MKPNLTEVLQAMAGVLEPLREYMPGSSPVGLDEEGNIMYDAQGPAQYMIKMAPDRAAKVLSNCLELFMELAEKNEPPELPPA